MSGRFAWARWGRCLAAPLSVPEPLGAGAGCLLGIELWRISFTRLVAAMMMHDQLSAPQQHQACHQPQPARCAHCKLACEGLGLQVGASMMSCKIFKQSCKV